MVLPKKEQMVFTSFQPPDFSHKKDTLLNDASLRF